MAKKKRQAIAPATSKQTPEKNLTDSFQRKAWLQFVVVFLFISASIVYLYQEAAFSGYRLNISDVQGQGLPYEQFRQDFEKEHKEPALWLPHIFAGMPFHASGSYRIRYTVETFFQALPNFVATLYNGSFGLNLLLGALFMFILLRSYGVTVVAALAGAVIFVFTTKVLGTPHTNRITTFMHIPIIFLRGKGDLERTALVAGADSRRCCRFATGLLSPADFPPHSHPCRGICYLPRNWRLSS
jgi:hypothetical protein